MSKSHGGRNTAAYEQDPKANDNKAELDADTAVKDCVSVLWRLEGESQRHRWRQGWAWPWAGPREGVER